MQQDNRATVERLTSMMNSGDLSTLAENIQGSVTDDFVEEWPQSGERIRGAEGVRQLAENYPRATGTNPRMRVRRVSGSDDVYTIEGVIDYGDGVPVSYIGIAEMRDGRVARLTEYFANPFEAPEWRSGMVERMQPAAV
jgi:ketosteroid isomerase-like protein